MALILLLLGLLACGTADAGATKKCAPSPNGEECKKCCKAQGRSGYRFMSGQGCECL